MDVQAVALYDVYKLGRSLVRRLGVLREVVVATTGLVAVQRLCDAWEVGAWQNIFNIGAALDVNVAPIVNAPLWCVDQGIPPHIGTARLHEPIPRLAFTNTIIMGVAILTPILGI